MKTAMAVGALMASFVGAVPGLTAGPAVGSGAQAPVDPVWRDVVIQGQVTEVQPGWATVKADDWRPTCPPGKVCALYIMLGPTYRVDTSTAEFQTSFGQPMGEGELFVGERVVIYGVVPEVPGQKGGPAAAKSPVAGPGGAPQAGAGTQGSPSDSVPFLTPAAPPEMSAPSQGAATAGGGASGSTPPSANADMALPQPSGNGDSSKPLLLRARIIEEIQSAPQPLPKPLPEQPSAGAQTAGQ
ncbi:hypothetical protein [Kyrpidia tusciae]|uniref:Nucleic acid binding OB-fold tRNA/helicase-type n=1 Tax=Kyrpidia tusciae (strain DSM 2912 / NBRC 15312 / T2) TaxID=562970 RepID=D5WUT9_KYRT2|nr:hypothetical protein [Kyrpidia tusciae]ADG07411.1 hypothetical protein Btus_2764 [Kyrpidia tusciae DSM 2912]